MTEQQLRKKVVQIFESWLGWNEDNGKFKKIIDIYNGHKPLPRGYKVKYTNEWCATAVSAAFIKAGLSDIGLMECSCGRMIELYEKAGRWMENDSYVPKVGDVVMYYWKDGTNFATTDCTGYPNHVGLVVGVFGQTVKVIEGNKGESVAYRELAVNGRYIRGYCLPDYASKAAKDTTIEVDPARSYDSMFGGSKGKKYTVTASKLNFRTGANTTKKVIRVLEKDEQVTCYGYFTKTGATVWLCVKDKDGQVGFCSKKYLK